MGMYPWAIVSDRVVRVALESAACVFAQLAASARKPATAAPARPCRPHHNVSSYAEELVNLETRSAAALWRLPGSSSDGDARDGAAALLAGIDEVRVAYGTMQS